VNFAFGAENIARTAYEAAQRLEKNGVYEQALTQYLRLVEGGQDEEISLMAKLQAAKIYLNSFQDYAKARTLFGDIAKRIDFPNLAAEAVCNLGKANYQESQGLNDIKAALGEFQQVILVYRETAAASEALLSAAEIEETLGNLKSAKHYYRSILYESRDKSAAPPAAFRLARCYVVSGEVATAIEELQRLRLLYPSSPEAETSLRAASNLYRMYLLKQESRSFRAKDLVTMELDDVAQLEVFGPNLLLLGKADLLTIGPDGKVVERKPMAGIRCIRVERGSIATNNDRAVQIKGQMTTVEYQDDDKIKIFDKVLASTRNSFGETYVIGDFEGIWKLIPKEINKQKKVIAEPFASLPDRPGRLRLDTENWFYALANNEKSLFVLDRQGNTKLQIREDAYNLDSILDFALDGYDNLYLLGKKQIVIIDNVHRPAQGPKVLARVDLPFKNPRRIAVDTAGQIYVAGKKGIVTLY